MAIKYLLQGPEVLDASNLLGLSFGQYILLEFVRFTVAHTIAVCRGQPQISTDYFKLYFACLPGLHDRCGGDCHCALLTVSLPARARGDSLGTVGLPCKYSLEGVLSCRLLPCVVSRSLMPVEVSAYLMRASWARGVGG
jgi:hypothetical protein